MVSWVTKGGSLKVHTAHSNSAHITTGPSVHARPWFAVLSLVEGVCLAARAPLLLYGLIGVPVPRQRRETWTHTHTNKNHMFA